LHLSQLPRPQHHAPSDYTWQPVSRSTQGDRTACTIFTSGSTGRAKGVMISHRSLSLYAKMSPANLNIQPGDRLLHLLSVAFDGKPAHVISCSKTCTNTSPLAISSFHLPALLCPAQRRHGCTCTARPSLRCKPYLHRHGVDTIAPEPSAKAKTGWRQHHVRQAAQYSAWRRDMHLRAA
jgi:acyl-CoA synthetase (AMP-forming)/AMP-acid ligase II